MLINKRNLRLLFAGSAVVFLIAIYLSASSSDPQRSLNHIISQAQQHVSSSISSLTHKPVVESNQPPHESDTTTTSGTPTSETAEVAEPSPSSLRDDPGFLFDKWFFEADQTEYTLPVFDLKRLTQMAPRYWKGPGHPTFATYYASREATMQNPYFLGAQQIVYRLLWDQKSRTQKYPVTVFVAPFVEQSHRDYFKAAGAIVTELPLTVHHPDGKKGVAGRLIDMFSKLRMWDQEQYSRIAYMDCDAFPIVNIDDIFETAHEQECRSEMLDERERESTSGLCDYVFTGHGEWDGSSVNAGVMVIKPNKGLGEYLLRDSQDNIDKYDNGLMEQAFVNWFFRIDGPFPWENMPGEYNGGPDTPGKGLPLSILHGKLWALMDHPEDWTYGMFNRTWLEMLNLYASPEFVRLREDDNATWTAPV